MAVPFDHIASTYNSLLSPSAVALLQRKCVWNYVESVIPNLNGFEMLELTSGSGDDADLFCERGFNLIATDISGEMLKVTQKQEEKFSMQSGISSHYVDLDVFNETLFDKKFDLVFSNFGGLNSVSPDSMKKLLHCMPSILNPGGRFVGVVMPTFCAWETLFFLLRFRFRKAFRRLLVSETNSELDSNGFKSWFYRPSQIKLWAKGKFRVMNIKPVGVALPSAYLERFVKFKKHWLLRLNRIEKRLAKSALFSGLADNFIIDLQLMA